MNLTRMIKVLDSYSRQYYYRKLKADRIKYNSSQIIAGIIKKLRAEGKCFGMDKTYYYIKEQLHKAGIKAGRDKVRQIMREYGLKYKVKQRAKYPTPIALKDAENLMYGLNLSKPNQVWFSDITYLRTRKNGNVRLSLIMDGYSRRILSYELGNHKSIALKALIKAEVWGVPEIHHSDRGIDYVNDYYTGYLSERGIMISFSRPATPQDNGIMERTIGTLKNELGLKMTDNIEQLRNKIDKVIRFYNDIRTHWSCDLKTPSYVYFFN